MGNTKIGLAILGAAAALGLLADALLRVGPWGVNATLWIIILLIAMIALFRRNVIPMEGEGRWLIAPVVLFAAALAWRDSLTLKALDILALLILFGLIALRTQAGSIRAAGIAETAYCLLLTGLNTLCGSVLLLFVDICWREVGDTNRRHHLKAVVRGLVIAVPLLLVFGALLTSADAVFAHLLRSWFDIDLKTALTHLLMIGLFAWIVGGYLRVLLLYDAPAGATEERAQPVSLGILEIGLALGLLDALFLCFVVVQLRYFFGGAALVQSTVGLSYATYARNGFFELVAVAALCLPLLLTAHWLLRVDNLAGERLFRILASALLLLLAVIMASAVQRMRLYQSEYGLTELRLYVTAFMGWLGLVFLWFAATVLRARRERFIFGALVAGLGVIAALHVLNPDALIVRVNTQAARAGKTFDAGYIGSLSADSVPDLIAGLPSLKPEIRAELTARLRQRRAQCSRQDWRTWSLSRQQAAQALRASDALLQTEIPRP